jgi:hypothetical protein
MSTRDAVESLDLDGDSWPDVVVARSDAPCFAILAGHSLYRNLNGGPELIAWRSSTLSLALIPNARKSIASSSF